MTAHLRVLRIYFACLDEHIESLEGLVVVILGVQCHTEVASQYGTNTIDR